METVSHVTRVPLPACHSSSYRRAGTVDVVEKQRRSLCQEQMAAKKRRASDSSILGNEASKGSFQED